RTRNFYFTSRRRHTRSKRDWSSDVCSSDLYGFAGNIEFFNGNIIAKSKKPFAKSDYAVVLVKFKEDEFATTDVLNQTFAEIKKRSEERRVGKECESRREK